MLLRSARHFHSTTQKGLLKGRGGGEITSSENGPTPAPSHSGRGVGAIFHSASEG
jgi:hypothetical protein